MGESGGTTKCGTTGNRFRNCTTGSASCLLVTMILATFIAQSETSTKPGDSKVNNRPIIGILAQETTGIPLKFRNENFTSYIAASYVKGVEASGARVVPIMIGKDRDYYEDIVSKLNGNGPTCFGVVYKGGAAIAALPVTLLPRDCSGQSLMKGSKPLPGRLTGLIYESETFLTNSVYSRVLLPGGMANLTRSAVDGYADAGEHIYEIAMKLNDAGDYFPVFGICLGFEYLVVLAAGRGDQDVLVPCNCHGSLPLNFTDDYRGSKMFRGADDDIVDVLSTKPVTVNGHDFCVMEDTLVNHNLTKEWRATSFSDSKHGDHFVASIESNKYPFYGIQFHPEKCPYEWVKSRHYPSDKQAVITNRYFYDFFVNECRKNFHSFPSVAEETAKLIYNYAPRYTGFYGMFEQCYGFEPKGSTN